MPITADAIMEYICDESLRSWCEGCPATVVSLGSREGGLPIEPDEVMCPCDFEIGAVGCVMRAEYEEIERLAAELAALANENRR